MTNINVSSDIDIRRGSTIQGNVITYSLAWDRCDVNEDSAIHFSWSIPMHDILYRWHPGIKAERHIPPSWMGTNVLTNSIAFDAPVICFYNQRGINKYTCAASEFKKITELRFGVNELTKELDCKITLPLAQFTGDTETTFSIRIDSEEKPYEKAIAQVSQWWEESLDIMNVPDDVYDSFYSFWCSYHREIDPETVEKECEQVKALGIKSIIVDDGWQTPTTDTAEGYRRCGDWKPLKFPDMAEHVQRVHDMGLKYVLWYSVPYLGTLAEKYEEFKDKTLSTAFGTCVLDPRYKEVRDYLVETYKSALLEWNLDGFKLDFIDKFRNIDNIPSNDQMDIKDLSDAVFALMTEIKTTLQSIKADIMLEFRQTYIGPAMRSYGNFFRVSDCPNDFIYNRIHSVDLRLLSGNTAVHSDMLMWHNGESVENCALQIINILFATMQISVKLREQSPSHIKMIKFWLDFMKEHKKTLLHSELKAHDPQNLYTLIEGIEESKKIAVVHLPDKCVTADKKQVIIVNGTQENHIMAEFKNNYDCTVLDCMGNIVYNCHMNAGKICKADVPPSGLIIMNIIGQSMKA